MKSIALALGILLAALGLFADSMAQEYISGIIVPVTHERLTISDGEGGVLTLGQKDGLIKGDIGSISPAWDTTGGDTIGKCVITKASDSSSICEVIKIKREIDRNSLVFFNRPKYSDSNMLPLMIASLANIVKPFPPHRRINVYIYDIFDEKNNVTALSQRIKEELRGIFSQKKRIALVDNKLLGDLLFYPSDYDRLVKSTKEELKRAQTDVLVTGRYVINGGGLDIVLYKISATGEDEQVSYSIPAEKRYAELAAKVVNPYHVAEPKQEVVCRLLYKPFRYAPLREEKSIIIRDEAAGDPLIEYNVKKTEFNMVSPVDFKVKIDDQSLAVPANKEQAVSLPKGAHRIAVSFRRGYYLNEMLLYTSDREVAKEIILDVTKSNDVSVEVGVDPLPERESIAFKVYRKIERERHPVRAIRRAESDRIVEMFKD